MTAATRWVATRTTLVAVSVSAVTDGTNDRAVSTTAVPTNVARGPPQPPGHAGGHEDADDDQGGHRGEAGDRDLLAVDGERDVGGAAPAATSTVASEAAAVAASPVRHRPVVRSRADGVGGRGIDGGGAGHGQLLVFRPEVRYCVHRYLLPIDTVYIGHRFLSTPFPSDREAHTPTPTRHPDEPIAALDVLWDRRPIATRGPKATLTLDAIAAVAVEIADTDGVDACRCSAWPSASASRRWRSTGTCPTRTCCWP